MSDFFKVIFNHFNDFIPLLLGLAASTTASWVVARRNIPRSFRVAIIGFPKAGKTSLITAVFAFLFRRGARGASIVPRGEETITRINSHIADMESGRGVAPTRDQDLFAYRAEVKARSPITLFPAKYKLEIGDFPGEQSQSFVESEQPWLHNSSYFQWAMSADAFVFVVDAALVIKDIDNYVARQKSAVRAAWQRLQEHHIDGGRSLRSSKVILVYSKADLVLLEMDSLKAHDLHQQLDMIFSDLIDYLRRDNPGFKTQLTSIAFNEDGERLGIQKVASYILPRWSAL